MRGGGCTPDRTGLQPQISLIYGNLQGIFCSLQGIRPLDASKPHARSGGYNEIPYATEQGIFKGVTSKNREMLAPEIQKSSVSSDALFRRFGARRNINAKTLCSPASSRRWSFLLDGGEIEVMKCIYPQPNDRVQPPISIEAPPNGKKAGHRRQRHRIPYAPCRSAALTMPSLAWPPIRR